METGAEVHLQQQLYDLRHSGLSRSTRNENLQEMHHLRTETEE